MTEKILCVAVFLHLGEALVLHEPFHLRYTDVRCHLSAPVVNVNTRCRWRTG